jgi:diguanylate cyclase (GGDEF)-like protein
MSSLAAAAQNFNRRKGGHGMNLTRTKRGAALLVFMVGSCLTLLIFFSLGRLQYEQHREQLQHLSDAYARRIEMTAGYMLRKPKIITELVRMNPNDLHWFPRVAAVLQDDPAVLSFQLVRGGKVLAGYPADYKRWTLDDPAISAALPVLQKLAAANTSGVLYGPIFLKDGTCGLLGLDPIYFYTKQSRFEYWGDSFFLLRLPDALQMADDQPLLDAGYAYRISGVTGPDGESPVLAASAAPLGDNPVTSAIHVANGQWVLEASPVSGWMHLRGLFWELGVGMAVSVLLAALVYMFFMLREKQQGTTPGAAPVKKELHPQERGSQPSLLEVVAERCQAAPGHFLLCYLDLNHFQQVNDTYGRGVGDTLMQAVFDRLRGVLKEEDSLLRAGGDEFVAMLEPEAGEGWKNRVEQLDQAMRRMFVLADGKTCIDVSVSIGCAVYPQNAIRAEELVRLAAERMRENKERFAHN